jgi:hypothetical protein
MIDRLTLSLPKPASQDSRRQWQNRLQTALSRIAIAPNLPPQGILIVRHLPDPNPGQLLRENGWQNWEQAAQNSLLHCWRTAAYPARQSVSASANSVWFGDRAEWLACLSRDLTRGVARDRWWWQTILRSYSYHRPSETLTALWLEESQALPAAIALLWQWEGAGIRDLLLNFSTTQAQQIISQLILTYELPSLPENSQLLAILMPLFPHPIRSCLPILAPEHQGLLALGLTLPHSLSLLRSRFASAAASLTQFNSADQNQVDENKDGRPIPVDSTDKPPLRAISDGQAFDTEPQAPLPSSFFIESPAIPLFPNLVSDRPIADRSSLGDRPSLSYAVSLQSPNPVSLPIATESTSTPSPISQSSPIPPDITNQSALPSNFSLESPAIPLFPNLVSDRPITDRSSLGDRPPSATPLPSPNAVPPVAPESSLNPALIPQSSPIKPDNPELGIATSLGGLWYLVNVLIDLNWLSDLPPLDPWHQLSAIAQALLPDIPPDPTWGILTELAGDSPFESDLQTWQTQALERVNAYLDESLEYPADFPAAIAEPAILYLTRTHVDLTFSLDRVRLDIRQAGLDRDPGWVPELARAIAFHYE